MRQIFFALAFVSATFLFGQKTQIEIGPEMKIPKSQNIKGLLHSDATGYYLFLSDYSGRKMKPIIQKFDKKYKLQFTKEYEIDQEFQELLYGGQQFILCTRNDETKGKSTFSATLINTKGVAQKPKTIATIAYKEKNEKPNKTIWKMSQDTTKMLFVAFADETDRDKKLKAVVAVYDQQLNKIWQQIYNAPYTQEQFEATSWSVANNGKVFMLGKFYDESYKKESTKKDGKSKPAYKLSILQFDQNSEKPKEYKLELKDKFVSEADFVLSANNDIYCSGFYANDTKGVLQGIFFTRIDSETGEIKIATKKDIPKQELEQFSTSKDKDGSKGLDASFKFKNIEIRNDGSIVISAENQYQTSRIAPSSTPGGNSTTYTYYHHEEVFVASIDVSGEFVWIKMVPKKQILTTNEFNSYISLITDDHIYFIYNDDDDNIKRALTDKPRKLNSYKDAMAASISIKQDGTISRQKLFDNLNDETTLMIPELSRQINAREVFFVSSRFKLIAKKTFRIGTIKL